ncbi:MAG: AI-2E family transporter [Desulfatirhabdiaceae bacterium]
MTDPLFRKILLILSGLLIIILGFHAFNQVKGMLILILNILSPFLIALILAYILAPIVVALQKKLKLGRIMGAVILYLLIFGVLFILLTFLIPTVLTELIRLFEMIRQRLPGIINSLSETLNARMDSNAFLMVQNWLKDIEIDFEKIFSSVLPGLKQFATGGMHAMGQTAKGIVSGAGAVIGFFSFIVFVGIIHFYLILDWEKIPPLIQKIVPYQHRDRLFDIMDKMDAAMGGFLRGQLTVSAIVGGMFALGLFVIGFAGFPTLRHYCILIGTLSAIGGFIPYLGPIIGVTPAILIILLTGDVIWETKLITLITTLGLFVLIQTVEGMVLQPRIVGKGAGLHPLVVMLALIIGAQLGIGGMVIAVPVASVIRVLIREFYWLPLEQKNLNESMTK